MPTPGVEPLLELKSVSKTFAGAVPVRALRDVSVAVSSSETVAIVGRSGSGKSTLLNVLGLLDKPSAGTYLIESRAVESFTDRELTRLRSEFFGFVFQQSFLLSAHTALENVEIALRPQRVPARDRRARATAALESVGLARRRFAMPGTMSGGERQRTAIARALVQRPKAILCDEPTGNLDERTAADIQELLVGLAQHETAVIMVTHDLSIARALGRVVSVRDGVLREGIDLSLGAGL